MQMILGSWYGGAQSHKQDALLKVDNSVDATGSLSITDTNGLPLAGPFPLSEVNISARLGNTPRRLNFANQACFETSENDAIDQILKTHQPSIAHNLVHKLERHWHSVFIATAVVCFLGWGSIVYGLPFMAEKIAYRLPAGMLSEAGEQTLEVMDKHIFSPSELPIERQHELRAYFQSSQNKVPVKIEFRSGMGANAFALPDGTIIFTDEMVKLAQSDLELLSIFGHEVGHLVYRHSLRATIQNSSIVIALTLISGDVNAASSLISALPVVLIEMAYSRDFELEADKYAYTFMREQNQDPKHFANILTRLQQQFSCPAAMANDESDAVTIDPDTDDQDCDQPLDESSGYLDYLMSHPVTSKRLEYFNQTTDDK